MFNLHTIFAYIVSDETFLTVVIDSIPKKEKKVKIIEPNKYSFVTSIMSEYMALPPSVTQEYKLFPSIVKEFLNPSYVRLGIKNIIDRDLDKINISFLNSLNMLLRPELYHY